VGKIDDRLLILLDVDRLMEGASEVQSVAVAHA
jgi:hypothetical protein